MSQEEKIQQVVVYIEEYVEKMYKLKFSSALHPTAEDPFKASAMAEIARRVRNRAVKIEEDWAQFTREGS